MSSSLPSFYFKISIGGEVCCIVKWAKCQYLGPLAINEKTKDTLLSQTLKVEEKKVSLVFLLKASEPRYSHCLIFHVFPFDADLRGPFRVIKITTNLFENLGGCY